MIHSNIRGIHLFQGHKLAILIMIMTLRTLNQCGNITFCIDEMMKSNQRKNSFIVWIFLLVKVGPNMFAMIFVWGFPKGLFGQTFRKYTLLK